MIKTSDNQRKVLDYAQQHGPFRPRDVAEFAVHPEDISRLCRKGLLSRVGRGLYELADNEPSTNQTLVEACKRVPQGVVCLLSALRFHEIGTQLPHKVWLAIPSKAARPRIEYPPVELTYLTERIYCEGIEEHRTGGGVVRVYSVAKTLVDGFRFRNRVGVGVAVEALREVVTHRRRYGVTIGQISEVARKCRVGEVMRPYLETLIA
jgi:predicted transcriptional regulator of viral defense system